MTLAALLLVACLRPETRSWQTLAPPNEYVLMALAAWQLGYGLWTRSMPRLAIGGITLSIMLGQQLNASLLFAHDAYWITHLALLWCMLLPLFCRDALAKALCATGPAWIMLVATIAPLLARTTWPSAPLLAAAVITTVMLGIALLYLATLRVRWYVLAASWTASLAIVAWTATALNSLDDLQVRRGLTFYALGLMLLGVALIVSLWKAGFLQRAWNWLQSATALPPPVSGNSPQ